MSPEQALLKTISEIDDNMSEDEINKVAERNISLIKRPESKDDERKAA